MPEQRKKYIQKSQYKQTLQKVIIDIKNNTTDHYKQVALSGYKNFYRIRVGNLRIVYERKTSGNTIRYIGPRGDVYKHL